MRFAEALGRQGDVIGVGSHLKDYFRLSSVDFKVAIVLDGGAIRGINRDIFYRLQGHLYPARKGVNDHRHPYHEQ
jgi:hypothetical protein